MDITDNHHRTPVTVEGIEGTVVKLVAGGARSCALTREHGVQCWGQFYGPHGRDYRFEPDRVPGIGNEEVATLAAGNHFTCVLTKSNRVKCWGFHAELDKNVGQRNSEAPVLVPGL